MSAQGDELGDAQPVPVGDQDHGGTAMAVAVLSVAGGLDQAQNLLGGEVLARAEVGVAGPPRRYGPIDDSRLSSARWS